MAYQSKFHAKSSQTPSRPLGMLPVMNRRFLAILILAAVSIIFVVSHLSTPTESPDLSSRRVSPLFPAETSIPHPSFSSHPIMPPLTNATLKAALGRSAWHLFHTTMSRFPRKPTLEEQSALSTYIHLFARLYPCGDCAQHFTELLKKFPPQVGGRRQAEAWACHVHNQVNMRLEKDIFDCAHVSGRWDCGCGEEDEEEAVGEGLKLEKER